MHLELLRQTISQNSISKHCVIELCLYVGVSDNYKSAIRLCYMFIHNLHITLSKVFIMKLKIFKIFSIVYIEP